MKLVTSVVLAAGLAATLSLPTLAVEFDKPECVAPAKPGGGFDLTCRLAQAGLKTEIQAPIQVTFMPGGIGAVAINMFNTQRTDDPNAIVAFSSGSLLNIATGKYGEWTENDVRWLASAGADYGAVVVRADSPFKSLKDVMDTAKTDLTSIVFGAGGSVGSQDWMKAALLLKADGVDPKSMRYVAFDGGGEASAALLGGSIQVYTGDVAEIAPQLDAGTMRILAVMSDTRLPAPLDQIPTAKEEGFDAEWVIMRGFYMGKNVSDEAYNAWVDAFEKAYLDPDFAAAQKEKGLFPLDMAGEKFAADVKVRVDRMRGVAKDAGLIQ